MGYGVPAPDIQPPGSMAILGHLALELCHNTTTPNPDPPARGSGFGVENAPPPQNPTLGGAQKKAAHFARPKMPIKSLLLNSSCPHARAHCHGARYQSRFSSKKSVSDFNLILDCISDIYPACVDPPFHAFVKSSKSDPGKSPFKDPLRQLSAERSCWGC